MVGNLVAILISFVLIAGALINRISRLDSSNGNEMVEGSSESNDAN
jgi:hypothetical protein